VRDYARQKLAGRGTAEIKALRDRHAEFYASWVEQLLPDILTRSPVETSARLPDALRRIDAEHENVRSTLAWWLESDRPAPGLRLARWLAEFWMMRGLYAEGRRSLWGFVEPAERIAADSSRKPPDGGSPAAAIPLGDLAFAEYSIGLFASRQGDYHEARARYFECLTIWRELGDELALAVTLNSLGMTAWLLGDMAEAVDYLEESRRMFQRCDRTPMTIAYETNGLRPLGMVARARGDYARAAEYFRESLSQERWGGVAISGYDKARVCVSSHAQCSCRAMSHRQRGFSAKRSASLWRSVWLATLWLMASTGWRAGGCRGPTARGRTPVWRGGCAMAGKRRSQVRAGADGLLGGSGERADTIGGGRVRGGMGAGPSDEPRAIDRLRSGADSSLGDEHRADLVASMWGRVPPAPIASP
jgi:tetratricopeptide (TPR) repeat protein